MSIYYVGVLPIRGLQCQWTPLLAEGSLAAGIRQRDGVRTARRGPSSETRSLQWDGVPPARRGPSNGTGSLQRDAVPPTGRRPADWAELRSAAVQRPVEG